MIRRFGIRRGGKVNDLDLSVEICGVRLPNPTVLASGILGLSSEVFERLARSGLGAVTTKSVSLQPRPGYKNPVIVDYGPVPKIIPARSYLVKHVSCHLILSFLL